MVDFLHGCLSGALRAVTEDRGDETSSARRAALRVALALVLLVAAATLMDATSAQPARMAVATTAVE